MSGNFFRPTIGMVKTLSHDGAFLAGDSVHVIPPTCGAGLEFRRIRCMTLFYFTDGNRPLVAHDVLAPAFVETYDEERRPVTPKMLDPVAELNNKYSRPNQLSNSKNSAYTDSASDFLVAGNALLRSLALAMEDWRQTTLVHRLSIGDGSACVQFNISLDEPVSRSRILSRCNSLLDGWSAKSLRSRRHASLPGEKISVVRRTGAGNLWGLTAIPCLPRHHPPLKGSRRLDLVLIGLSTTKAKIIATSPNRRTILCIARSNVKAMSALRRCYDSQIVQMAGADMLRGPAHARICKVQIPT
ncbi:hypothetical protein EDB19DRAFT_1833289 [Suillus lakei]|nr:hypothetical protein EDB19DRAFT_1833289 [Suillus lakei]